MMDGAFPWIALVVGLCLGSFYTVCVHRYLTGGSLLWPGSHCPACGHRLQPWENIPLVSFLIQRGRCRACAAQIPWRYPMLEAISGAAATILALRFGLSPEFFVYLVATGIFLVAGAIDWETYLLPDVFTYPLAVLGLIHPLFVPVPWMDTVLGAVLGAGLLGAVREGYARVRHVEGLGLGDVKLMVGLGALVGASKLPLTILCASLLALGTFALCIARTSRSQGLSTAIPFGPFLCAGAWLVLVAGEWFSTWTLG